MNTALSSSELTDGLVEEFHRQLKQLMLRCESGESLRRSVTGFHNLGESLYSLQNQIWGIDPEDSGELRVSPMLRLLDVGLPKGFSRGPSRFSFCIGSDPLIQDSLKNGASNLYGLSEVIFCNEADPLDRWNRVARRIYRLAELWLHHPVQTEVDETQTGSPANISIPELDTNSGGWTSAVDLANCIGKSETEVTEILKAFGQNRSESKGANVTRDSTDDNKIVGGKDTKGRIFRKDRSNRIWFLINSLPTAESKTLGIENLANIASKV